MRVFITYGNDKTESFHKVQKVENIVNQDGQISGLIMDTATGFSRRDFNDKDCPVTKFWMTA